MVGFRESLRQGAQMLELDVRLSRDGIPFVMHDSTLKRATGGKPGTVSARTSRHIQSLQLDEGVTIPTLEEVLLELCPQIPINVEMKFNRPELRPLAQGVAQVITRLGFTRHVLVSSFFHQSLQMLKKVAPDIITAPLFGTPTGPLHDDDLDEVLSGPLREGPIAPGELPFRGRVAVLLHSTVTPAIAERFRQAQGTLLVYTVDAPADLARMVALGVDGIITNRPALAFRVLETLDT